MKIKRFDDLKPKTLSDTLPDGSRKKKKNEGPATWKGGSAAESAADGGNGSGSAGTAWSGPTYSEIMQKYYAGQYADALAGNKRRRRSGRCRTRRAGCARAYPRRL